MRRKRMRKKNEKKRKGKEEERKEYVRCATYTTLATLHMNESNNLSFIEHIRNLKYI